jgi:hypothetical protein
MYGTSMFMVVVFMPSKALSLQVASMGHYMLARASQGLHTGARLMFCHMSSYVPCGWV